VAEKPRSDLYRDMLPALNSGRVLLPRNDRLISQLVGLERRTTRAVESELRVLGSAEDLDVADTGLFELVERRGDAGISRDSSMSAHA
jgi:hypothetical protein